MARPRQPKPDRLILQDITAESRLGVFEWEQQTPQTISVDLELTIDARQAARQDDVTQAVDYAQVVGAVKQLAEGKPYRLLETMAEEIAALVLRQFATQQVKVRVRKRSLPGIGYAAVELERGALRRRREAPRDARADRRPARIAAPR